MFLPNSPISQPSGLVVDGRERAASGIESEVRAEVTQNYAEQWNAAGFVQRRRLRRLMEQEIADRVKQAINAISPDSNF